MPFATDDTAMMPPPVPMPPSSTLPARLANQGHTKGDLDIFSEGERILQTPPLTLRVKRSETLPSVIPNKTDTEISMEDFPKNPKSWTPPQLSVYLSSALRMKGGAKLPVPVVRDIGLFVMKEHINGRAFLRMNKADYDALGINQLWKDALFDASRALRQNLVQGRIMGFGAGPLQLSPSTDELLLVPEEDDSGSDPLPSYGPLNVRRRRTSSSIPRQWEEDKNRMSKTSFRAGRVRGMIETYERSFSESSASGSECEDQEVVPAKIDAHQLVCEPEDEGGFASGEDTGTSDGEGNAKMVSESGSIDAGPDSLSAKAPAESNTAFPELVDGPPSQLSVEALLHEHEGSGLRTDPFHSWGAKAWEDEANGRTGLHVTAKRIPLDTQTVNQKSRPPDITESPGTGSAPKGLTELFSQLTIDEPSPLKTTRDIAVSAEDQIEVISQVPGPSVYEVLQTLQNRLEIVENRLDEMERKEADMLQQTRHEVEQHHEKVEAKHEDMDVAGEHHLPPSSGALHDTEPEKEQQATRNYIEADPSITELPRYMLLISLGVVAITTRVVLQRVIGNRKRT